MSFIKGRDGVARTINNPLEGAVGDINLDNITSTTMSATANVTGGNVLTSGIMSAGGNTTAANFLGNIYTDGYYYANSTPVVFSAYGNANVASFLADLGANAISTSGNITGNYVFGNGSQLTGLPATYGNANVAGFLADFGSNTISTTGNITTTGVNPATGYVTIGSGDGSGLLVGAGGALFNADNSDFVIYGNLSDPGASITVPSDDSIANGLALTIENLGSNVEITAVGNTWIFDITGNLVLPSNSANINYSNGVSILNGISGSYGNANVAAFLAAYGSNTISTSGNITAGNFIGNISVTGNITGTASNVDIIAGSYQWIFNNAGNLVLPGNTFTVNYANGTAVTLGGGGTPGGSNSQVQFNDNNTFGGDSGFTYDKNADALTVTGNTTVGNLLTAGRVSATGNVTGSYLFGNISQTTGGYGNANVVANLAALSSNPISTTGNITAGNIIVTGNATTGITAVTVGVTNTILPNTIASFSANVNNYTQLTLENTNGGADATADFILTADNGTDTVNYGDFGIINSGYDVNTPTNSLGNIVYAADTYIYAQGNTSNTAQSGGNLVLGVTTTGKNIKLFAGGANTNALVATVSNTGITMNSGNITGNTAGFAIGYRDIPQVSFAANATISTTDAGKHYYSTSASNLVFTIANNASQAFATGATINIINAGTGTITVARGSGVTLYLAGNSTSADRSISTYGLATVTKVATDTWFIVGAGVT